MSSCHTTRCRNSEDHKLKPVGDDLLCYSVDMHARYGLHHVVGRTHRLLCCAVLLRTVAPACASLPGFPRQ
jgi:hypothetical protein